MSVVSEDGSQEPNPRRGNGQTRKWSAIESCTTMFVGYFTAVAVYQLLWPLFGHEVRVWDSASVALLMFPVNYVRQYLVRRAFNWLENRNGVTPLPVAAKSDPSSPFD